MEAAYLERDHKDQTKTVDAQITYMVSDSRLDDHLYCIHYMLKSAWGSNYGAPIKDLLSSDSDAKVLDFGCGAGIWTLEMATEFPLAKFYGIDSMPTFPDSVLPDNVEFMITDTINNGLPFKDEEFDYIYCRNVIFAFQTSSLKSIIIKELLRVLKPGGYIELMEGDNQGYQWSDNLKFWNVGLKSWLTSMGIDCLFIDQCKEYLESINQLEDVIEQKIKILCGKDKGDHIEGKKFIGELCAEISITFMRSVSDKLMSFLELTREEYDNLIKKIETEIKDENNSSSYFWYRRFIAKKLISHSY